MRRRVILNSGEEEFVDLGLSVLWAKGNICKDSDGKYYMGEPYEYGCYYSWGNIDGHNFGERYNFDQNTYNGTAGSTVYGNIRMNDSAHDAALACLGEGRMPTNAEWQELKDNCTWTWDTNNDINGYMVSSKKTGYRGKSIFLPAAGMGSSTQIIVRGNTACYWTSSK